jgi:hypothetical protein
MTIDGQCPVRIDSHKDFANIGINCSIGESLNINIKFIISRHVLAKLPFLGVFHNTGKIDFSRK